MKEFEFEDQFSKLLLDYLTVKINCFWVFYNTLSFYDSFNVFEVKTNTCFYDCYNFLSLKTPWITEDLEI